MDKKEAERRLQNLCNDKTDDGILLVTGQSKLCIPLTDTVYNSRYARALAVMLNDAIERIVKLEANNSSLVSIKHNIEQGNRYKRNDIVRVYGKEWRVDHVDGSTIWISNDENEHLRIHAHAVDNSTANRIDDFINQV